MNLKIHSYKIGEQVYISGYGVVKSSDTFISHLQNLDSQVSDTAIHEISISLDGEMAAMKKSSAGIEISFKDKSYPSLNELLSTEFESEFNQESFMKNFINISGFHVTDQQQLAAAVTKLGIDVDTTTSIKSEFSSFLDTEISKASEEAKKSLERFQDLTQKIYSAEEKVDTYNNYQKVVKDSKDKRDSILREKEKLTQILSSSKELIESKNRLENEVKTVLDGADPKELMSKAQQLKENRKKQLVNYMNDTKSQHKFDPEEKERNLMIPKTFVIILLAQTLISITVFFGTGDIIAFLYLILSAVVAIGGGIVFQIHSYDAGVLSDNGDDERPLVIESNRKFNLTNDSSEEKDLIKYAWVEALNKDLEEVIKSLNQRLGNMTYDQLQASLANLDQNLIDVDAKLKKLDEGKIDQDEYYKFRRELDIFSIERENLLVNLEGKVDNGVLENIKYNISRISDAKKSSDKKQIKLPFIIFNLKEKINWIKEIPLQSNTQVLFFE
jgi:hypothetical protein